MTADPATPPLPSPPNGAPPGGVLHVRVLLVEDLPTDAALVIAALRRARNEHYEIKVASNMAQAREAMRDFAADVWLIDLTLPDSRGLDMVRAGRAMAGRVPLIVLTGHDDAELALQTLQAGAQDYLVKDALDTESLVRAIRYARGRLQLEQALLDAEERWRFALEGSSQGVWDRNLETGAVYFSRQWKAMLGYDDADITNHSEAWSSRLHPDDAPRVFAEMQAHLQADLDGSPAPYVSERRLRCKDGSWKWVVAHGMIVSRDAQGRAVRVIGTTTDISQAKAAQEALRASEQRYQRLVHNVGDAIVVDDLKGRISFANQRFLALLGLDSAQGLALEAHVAPEYRSAWQQQRELAMQSGGVALALPYEAVRADGSRLWLEAQLTGVIEAGHALGVQAAIRDITLKRQSEAAERARAMAEQASLAKSEFVSRVSHELRTPLNAILGFSEILLLDQDHPLREDQQRRVERIYNAGDHLLVLINDLLDITRIEAGAMRLQLEDIEPAVALREAMRDLAPMARSRDVRISMVQRGGSGCARGDRSRLRQVVHKLLSNAIKYSRSGGLVALHLERDAEHLRLRIADTGIGMSAQQMQSLFQPFNRLGQESGQVQGTGIGLVITKYLVELMGGSLSVRSEPGQGSCVEVLLRASPVPSTSTSTPTAVVPPAAPQRRGEISGHVLYIDDLDANRALMQAYFELRPALQLHLAPDAATGIEAAVRLRPALVLIDMHLPDQHGLQVLQAIRARSPSQPCIAVSAQAMPEDVAAALAAGFDAYLTKPISASTLLAAIDRYF